jgi:hypothetical protein
MPVIPNISTLKKLYQERTDPLPEKRAEDWPELAKSWAGRQYEMPNESKGVNNLRPMNMLERMYYGPTVNAATYPGGSIALNRQNIEKNKINMDNLLVHELTHIGQGQRGGIMKSYAEGGSMDMPPYEREAYDAENNRMNNVRTTDIELKPPRMGPPSPIQTVYNPKAIKK